MSNASYPHCSQVPIGNNYIIGMVLAILHCIMGWWLVLSCEEQEVKCGRRKLYLGVTKQEGKLNALTVQQKASSAALEGVHFTSISEPAQGKKLCVLMETMLIFFSQQVEHRNCAQAIQWQGTGWPGSHSVWRTLGMLLNLFGLFSSSAKWR